MPPLTEEPFCVKICLTDATRILQLQLWHIEQVLPDMSLNNRKANIKILIGTTTDLSFYIPKGRLVVLLQEARTITLQVIIKSHGVAVPQSISKLK
jgi:hypothetical protein